MFKKRIYLDYASLTPLQKGVIKVVREYSGDKYANASSWYKEGVSAKKILDESRKQSAGALSAHPNEIVFTSGGTEGNNMAVVGAVEWLHGQGVPYEDIHIVISAIEHSSIRECANHLNDLGVEVDVVSVDENGLVDLEDLKKKIKPNTALVSIMMVNNEIGSIQPIRDIAKVIRHEREKFSSSTKYNFQDIKYPLFHTDAAQALCQELNVQRLGVDLLTLDGSKIYGPRGSGILYVKKGTKIKPVIYGGGQEYNLRSGTENIASIAGMTYALQLAANERVSETSRLNDLRKYFLGGLKEIRADIKMHGSLESTSPHIMNISIPNIDNEFFVLQLDASGIACSTKSSCLRDEDESYVLKSIGANSADSIRISLGRGTTKRQLKKALRVFRSLLAK